MPTPREHFDRYLKADELPAQQMTIAHFESLGYRAWPVERFIPTKHGGYKRDCWGFADLVVFHPEKPRSLGFIQATVRSEHTKRFMKILAHARAYELVCQGYRVGLASWERTGVWSRKPYFKWFTRRMFESLPPGFSWSWNPRGAKPKALRDRAAVLLERLPADAWAAWEAGRPQEARLFA